MSDGSYKWCEVCGRVDYDCVCDEPTDASPTWWQERCASLAFKNKQLRILLDAEDGAGDEIERLHDDNEELHTYIKTQQAEIERLRVEADSDDAALAEAGHLADKQQAEINTLHEVIDRAAQAWLSLDPPTPWEGDVGDAMVAAVAEIRRLRRELASWEASYKTLRERHIKATEILRFREALGE